MSNITEDQVIGQIKQVFDPEVPVDVWNFGLIHDVAISDADEVNIRVTLTSEACPSARQIPIDVEKKIMQLPGVKSCDVEVVWEPKWTVERISAEGREKLGLDDEE